jgi:hypothetical protein
MAAISIAQVRECNYRLFEAKCRDPSKRCAFRKFDALGTFILGPVTAVTQARRRAAQDELGRVCQQ